MQYVPWEPEPVNGLLDPTDEGPRLLFLPSDPESFEVKYAEVEGYQSLAGKWMDALWEVNEDESVETLRVLAVS